MKFNFPVIIVDKDYRSDNIAGTGMRALGEAIEALGTEVVAMTHSRDFIGLAQQAVRASAFIVSIDEPENGEQHCDEMASQTIRDLRSLVTEIRQRNADIPIFLYGRTHTSRHLPIDITREMHGFIHMFEDTNEFMARHILREAKTYLDDLFPPFFGRLVNYAQNSSYSWHAPGHSGGVAFLKSPVGQLFHQFFGENMLRADVCNSVEELGQPLLHTGSVRESEDNAARIFKADHCFFVTNGTSTSNKMVWHANVAPNDIVIVDRNCHKSSLHAIIMTGAIPVFLTPTRNKFGIIGPIPKSEFSMATIQRKINEHPFIEDKTAQPRLFVLTQCTYDGVMYNAQAIKRMLDGKVQTLMFDEAWMPHAYFHTFYDNYYSINGDSGRTQYSTVFATQSTHKLLAALSQASQILVQDAVEQPLDRHRFNEAFLMHASTSPQYSIIASCDVAAAMMEGEGGQALTNDSLLEAMDFRHAMHKADEEYANSWWFKVWGPDALPEHGVGKQSDWAIMPNDRWHGFSGVEKDMNILDPIKTTILMPGLDIDGDFADMGIPATLVANYLADYGIIIEKVGLYSIFLIFNIGITKGKWNTLLTELQQFKDIYDDNKPLVKIFPEFIKENPCYAKLGMKDLCQQIHEAYKAHDIARIQHDMYIEPVIPAMRPADAWAKMARRQYTRVNVLDLTTEHITGSLVTPYPPGIPLLVPGERFNQLIIEFLHFALEFNGQFPGFEQDVHGLIKTTVDGKMCYFVDCVEV
ncbi:Biodegradative arginine decarboxylase [Ephemeroptericola cinctiostellae]|uniref:Biodegradative arginine decarboxylase n=1 Tax=Ephemeroptericola cinctiostellae TaxID=2268024 RepID=A0A345D8P5_9BURK|nr:Orn/Lys/Arg decarboxylase N-terminal domain-containing protein [Ephemeroptericola cinctiostellae]AXF84733.1 Biodegradative arginine decarboxylase [Ephemeroptericola cinctiostellae]